MLWGSVLVLGALLPTTLRPAHAGGMLSQKQVASAENYRVSVGDVLGIAVLRHPEFTMTAQVLPDGTFAFPILGRLTAAGKTREQIAAEITKGLKDKRQLIKPDVTVNVIQQNIREITVLGAVRGAGKLALKDNWTVLDALGAAGGVGTAGATASDRFEFYRAELFRDTQVISLDLAKVYANDPSQNILLKNEDKIYVAIKPRTEVYVTVIGEVGQGRGGSLDIPKDRSIITLLNDMGGVTDRAALSKATILRKGEVLKVDLRGYKKGQLTNNILLDAGDILTIPRIEDRYKINGALAKGGGELDYPDDRTLTLFEALTQVGIPPTGAELKKVKLTRSEKGVTTTQDYNVEKMLKGDRSQDIVLLPGDEIFVPAVDSSKRRMGTQEYISLLGLLPGLYFILRGSR
jgi:protein involved in polysaccharide export with SLBB domain